MNNSGQEVIIKVEGLYKKFCKSLKKSMLYGTGDVLRSMIGFPPDQFRLRKDEFWALEDINFELYRGETLGIIGVNGSGKSTLLRLLNGIFPPDHGQIMVNGKIGALIAVGAGFHPHMTGQENIYLNGTILGMSRKEIDAHFDEIVDFSEIGEFLDAPVATYSSGMKVRLGFSIAVHGNPDILLVDEILSVGDIGFRNKSHRKMHEFGSQANGIIFISHNLEQVRTLCDRVIILDRGRIIYDGSTHQGCLKYEELSLERRRESLELDFRRNQAHRVSITSPDNEVEILEMGILNTHGEKVSEILTTEELTLYCDFLVNRDIEDLCFSGGVMDENNKAVIWRVSNDNNKIRFVGVKPGTHRLLIKIGKHHLVPRIYIPNIAIRNGITNETYQRIVSNTAFAVKAGNNELERGMINVNEEWMLSDHEHEKMTL